MSVLRFITLEGGEGAGKSTQARLLADRLGALGLMVVLTREPGGSPFAERLRDAILAQGSEMPDPLAQALAFFAARADHISATIKPALETGAFVISDRFSDSTRVYQGAAGGAAPSVLDALEQIVVGDHKPGLTLVLDLPAEVGLERVGGRRAAAGSDLSNEAADMFEARDLAFHETLRTGFQVLVAREPERCRVIDARGSVQEISAAIWEQVVERFGLA